MSKNILRILLGLPKSLVFNLRHFPLKTALRCPVLLDNHVKIISDSAKITIPENLRTGKIKIGFGSVGIFDRWKSRTLLELKGTIIFEGEAMIGHGSRISVFHGGVLRFCEGFSATAEMTLICTKEITLCKRAMIGWSTLIIDSDFHITENPLHERTIQLPEAGVYRRKQLDRHQGDGPEGKLYPGRYDRCRGRGRVQRLFRYRTVLRIGRQPGKSPQEKREESVTRFRLRHAGNHHDEVG